MFHFFLSISYDIILHVKLGVNKPNASVIFFNSSFFFSLDINNNVNKNKLKFFILNIFDIVILNHNLNNYSIE
jgi:hypothetical protein